MDVGRHRLVDIARDHDGRGCDRGIARRLLRDRLLQADDVPGVVEEFARPQQQCGGRVLHIAVRHHLRQEHVTRTGRGEQSAERKRDRISEQRADQLCRDEVVVPADAAAPGMGDRRQHDEARDALRIIERNPRTQRAAPGMHHEDRFADADLLQHRIDHPALHRRRRIFAAHARAPAMPGPIDQDHAMMFG